MQLVELQRNVHEPRGEEIAVFAVSYDPVDVLAAFATKHGITFPLLGDVGSETITSLGLLNTQIVDERAFWGKPVEDRHRGLPYPGTFMLDEDGTVTEKVFERSHRLRPGGKLLLGRLGVDANDGAPVVTAEAPGLAVAAWPDSEEYFPNQIMRLTLRMAVEDGYHVYVPPNPDGFTDLKVTVGGPDGVFVHDEEVPDGHPFRIEGFDEEFTVADGEFDVVIRFYVLEDTGSVTLDVTVSYQACSDRLCLAPDTLRMSINLQEIRA